MQLERWLAVAGKSAGFVAMARLWLKSVASLAAVSGEIGRRISDDGLEIATLPADIDLSHAAEGGWRASKRAVFVHHGFGSEVDLWLTFHDQSGCSSALPLTTDVLALMR